MFWRILRPLAAILLVVVAVPLALAAGLFSRPRKCTPEELAATLRRIGDGLDSNNEWDDLECGGPLADRRLEEIRREAMTVDLPLGPDDRAKLIRLAERAANLPVEPQSRKAHGGASGRSD